MPTCKVPIKIEEILNEFTAPGIIFGVSTLSAEQTTGLLTSMGKQKGQDSDVVSSEGVGLYGQSKFNLEDVGVIKSGLNTSDDPNDLVTVLSDPSIFTGKHGVTKVEDLLSNEGLQRQLIQDVVLLTLNKLTQQGLITGNESDADIAAIGSLSTDFTFDQIKGFISGTIIGALLIKMDALADSARYAINLLDFKGLVPEISLKVPKNATNTIKTANLDAELDKLIGSSRIESAVSGGSSILSKVASLDKGDIF